MGAVRARVIRPPPAPPQRRQAQAQQRWCCVNSQSFPILFLYALTLLINLCATYTHTLPNSCPHTQLQHSTTSLLSRRYSKMGAFLAKMLDQVMSSFKTEARILMVSAPAVPGAARVRVGVGDVRARGLLVRSWVLTLLVRRRSCTS